MKKWPFFTIDVDSFTYYPNGRVGIVGNIPEATGNDYLHK